MTPTGGMPAAIMLRNRSKGFRIGFGMIARGEVAFITEGINFQIDAESKNADNQKLQEILSMAEKRCPSMYGMSHNIGINARII